MNILPKNFKFAPVQIPEKEVNSWDDLDSKRARFAPILGKDDWFETFKYNISNVIFIDLLSKAFGWVLIANGILMYLLYEDANHSTWTMDSLTTWFAWGNAIGSLLHFAAKDEFKKVINAACSRWSGGRDIIQGPTTTTTTTVNPKDKKDEQ